MKKNTTNEQFLQILYEAFFDRLPDESGKQGWLEAMQTGTTREEVLNGFVFAAEFEILCDQYDIKAHPSHHRKSHREGVEAFVTRFYQLCLGRDPDPTGLEVWKNDLLNQVQTGADVARGFIYSQEFINKNTSNEEYLTILYNAFFNRDPDPDGWNAWIADLNAGRDRGEVLDGFIYSLEFYELANSFGIIAF